LHSTKLGTKLMASMWNSVDRDIRKEANFQRECLHGFEKLEPQSPIFWQNCTGGLLNHEDFFETIAKSVRIYSGDVEKLDANFLCLTNGEKIPSDVILCGTGWELSLQFFTDEQCRDLGLPSPKSQIEKDSWTTLDAEADAKVITKFPILANPPPHFHKPATETPFRLYRNIVPISESGSSIEDRSIVFIGQVGVGNYFPTVECQSLWAMAYLDGKLVLPSRREQEKEVALFTTWCRRRYLSNGEGGNAMPFEMIGYLDTLLGDLGLKSHRKGWFKDLFSPYWAKDFMGLKGEFVKKYGYGEDAQEKGVL